MATSDPPKSQAGCRAAPSAPAASSTGGGRIARNVVANWVWYLLVLISGFVLPRLLDRHQGQELLGIWDLGWSLVFHISLLALGIASAVQRYVARLRTVQDWAALNNVASTCLALLSAGAVLGLAASAVLAACIQVFLPNTDPALYGTARWVVFLLCASAAVQMPASVFNAVITGYERYDVLNLLRGVRDLVVLVVMGALLIMGQSLVALAWVTLLGEIVLWVANWVAARRLCRPLRLSVSSCHWSTAREVIGFGFRAVLQTVARTGLYQVNSLFVAFFLGPAVLAVYARQRALVMHLWRFVKQYAQVFIPASSALDARADTAALQRLLTQSSKYGLYVTLPATVLLLVMGGPLLNVWMGPSYEAPLVLGVLAVAHLLAVPQLGAFSILLGMGRHGWPAVFELVAAGIGIAAGLIVLGPLQGGTVGAAATLALPIAVNGGIVLPAYACRVLQLSWQDYLRAVVPGPVLAGLPFTCCLVLARLGFPDTPPVALMAGAGAGGVVTVAVYWRWVVPGAWKARALSRLRGRRCRVPILNRAAVASSEGT